MADRENFIITGNATSANNQYTGGGGGFIPLPGQAIQYGRVVSVNLQDRSITYETIQNNLGVSALNKPNKITGTAFNFNPNFTRLPKEGELVPLIPGPNNQVGGLANQYNQVLYYIIGSISTQVTVDDNKVPQDVTLMSSDNNSNYKLNDIGINQPTSNIFLPPNSGTSSTPTKVAKGIIIGDSLSPSIKSNSKKLEPLSPSGVLWQSGIALNTLNKFVTIYPVDKTITHVFITIGTNDVYVETTSISKFVNLLRTKFPSAKLYIIKGLYGYAGIVEGGKNYFGRTIVNLPQTITNYYKKWTDLGVNLLQNEVGKVSSHPGSNTPSVRLIGAEIDRILSNY